MLTKTKSARSARLEKLKHLLAREKMTLAEVRKLLVPMDPWEAARGLWKGRKVDAVGDVRRLRKEWDRRMVGVTLGDAVIAATAQARNATLVTRDRDLIRKLKRTSIKTKVV